VDEPSLVCLFRWAKRCARDSSILSNTSSGRWYGERGGVIRNMALTGTGSEGYSGHEIGDSSGASVGDVTPAIPASRYSGRRSCRWDRVMAGSQRGSAPRSRPEISTLHWPQVRTSWRRREMHYATIWSKPPWTSLRRRPSLRKTGRSRSISSLGGLAAEVQFRRSGSRPIRASRDVRYGAALDLSGCHIGARTRNRGHGRPRR